MGEHTYPDINNIEEATRDELLYLATHDELTGLLNRRGFNMVINRLVDTMPRNFSVLLMDLDRLKPLNDEYGHDAGDAHLRKTAEIISGRLRTHPQTDPEERRAQPKLVDIVTAARIGGDEFAILLPGVYSEEVLKAIEQRIQRELSVNDIEASMYGRPHKQDETANNLIAEVDMEMLNIKEARRERSFKELPWIKQRYSKLGGWLIRTAGTKPPRI